MSDEHLPVMQTQIEALMDALVERGDDPVGFALAIPMAPDETGFPLLVSGQLWRDEGREAAMESALRIFADAIGHILENEPELRRLLPAIMVRFARATGGEVIETDLQLEAVSDEAAQSLTHDSPARRAAARRRAGGEG